MLGIILSSPSSVTSVGLQAHGSYVQLDARLFPSMYAQIQTLFAIGLISSYHWSVFPQIRTQFANGLISSFRWSVSPQIHTQFANGLISSFCWSV